MESLVFMTAIISSVTADALAAARALLQSHLEWATSISGFAYRILEETGTAKPNYMVLPPPATTPALLRRTPELAAYGYLLDKCDETISDMWLSAVEHLRGREIYPADRQSFIFNPIEILGIATGLTFALTADEHREWLADTILRGMRQSQFRTPLSHLAANVALSTLSATKSSEVAQPDLPLDLLTGQDLLLTAGISLAFPERTNVDPLHLENVFIQKLLHEPLRLNDTAEAAAAIVLCDKIVARAALMNSDVKSDERIVALCRRFPLVVHALQNRQRQRPPFEIKDEYDVQDILHGILRLHFDDVRPEEVTPSYAGNHSRVDFFLPPERIIVEAKMTRKNLGQREIIDELSIDTVRYSKMKTIDTLICIVYDPQRFCTNPRSIETDVEDSGGRLKVRVVVCPHGI
jgi:REase_DpnII-MboI